MAHDDSPGAEAARLQRCIRDLAVVQALPSMCIGRTPVEAQQILFEALPTALRTDLVYLEVPGAAPVERLWASGRELSAEETAALSGKFVISPDGRLDLPMVGKFHCYEAAVPVGAGQGRLIAGRVAPLDAATDRVLIRCAANLVGTALETANVLEAARRKDNFMAILGHELRNPLAPILTATEMLARHPDAAREQQVIHRNTRHLARLVDDLLDISRVTRGHVVLRSEDVSLSTVLERAVELATPLVNRNRHTLTVDDATGVLLRGDPVRLVQVFGNLLINAAKFTPPGGRIEVLVARQPGKVVVAVRDNGRGIARDHLKLIFEPFFQIDRERDAIRGGLGLGLPIVHDLVHRHGGAISASSQGDRKGSTFTVELPTIAMATAGGVSEGPRGDKASRTHYRVLIVDDNLDVADLLAEALRDEGYTTEAAHDGRRALEAWSRFVPHAGVLDVGLPDLDGYTLAREVRAQHGRVPVLIAATGYGQPTDRQRAMESGFDMHLVKPVSIRELLGVLDDRVLSAAAAAH